MGMVECSCTFRTLSKYPGEGFDSRYSCDSNDAANNGLRTDSHTIHL